MVFCTSYCQELCQGSQEKHHFAEMYAVTSVWCTFGFARDGDMASVERKPCWNCSSPRKCCHVAAICDRCRYTARSHENFNKDLNHSRASSVRQVGTLQAAPLHSTGARRDSISSAGAVVAADGGRRLPTTSSSPLRPPFACCRSSRCRRWLSGAWCPLAMIPVCRCRSCRSSQAGPVLHELPDL